MRVNQQPRKGCKDMWNSFMVDGAIIDREDIPFCETTATHLPDDLVAFWDLKTIHRREMKAGRIDYHVSAFAHFYGDDHKFDGEREGIWSKPRESLEILKHCDGFITPDFGANIDLLDPTRRHNTMRMRAFGHWAGQFVPCINNVRWGYADTYCYDFSGIPTNSIVAIGTVASTLNNSNAKRFFERGFLNMVERLCPTAIIVYGSANYPCFKQLEEDGTEIKQFDSKTNRAHKSGGAHE